MKKMTLKDIAHIISINKQVTVVTFDNCGVPFSHAIIHSYLTNESEVIDIIKQKFPYSENHNILIRTNIST